MQIYRNLLDTNEWLVEKELLIATQFACKWTTYRIGDIYFVGLKFHKSVNNKGDNPL